MYNPIHIQPHEFFISLQRLFCFTRFDQYMYIPCSSFSTLATILQVPIIFSFSSYLFPYMSKIWFTSFYPMNTSMQVFKVLSSFIVKKQGNVLGTETRRIFIENITDYSTHTSSQIISHILNLLSQQTTSLINQDILPRSNM